MNKFFLTTLIIICIVNFIFCQADLTVSITQIQPTSLKKGELFNIQALVSNIGNQTTNANYMFLYLSTDKVFDDIEIIGRVSIKKLLPNQTQSVSIIYSIPTNLLKSNYFIGLKVDPFNDVPEKNENNTFFTNTLISVTDEINEDLRIPSPIIFVHGLIGDSRTWNDFTNEADKDMGWVFGGRLDYCLNPDGDKYTSDKDGIFPFVNENTLKKADYYYVNFDVSRNGTPYVGNDWFPFNEDDSNQSAITKQGWAIKDAIKTVLKITGAEKVILVGHSMGGLAIRQYIQNPQNYQLDGKHHVAKLVTIGTPNQGSNFTVNTLINEVASAYVDVKSEAVRDLRYKSIEYSGLFLDGGIESPFTPDNNDDVDCNGYVGDNIIGLNQKTSPMDLDYACIASTGDEFVNFERADINNVLKAPPPLITRSVDKFVAKSGHLNIHKENHPLIIRSLDEPYLYDLAYTVPLNMLWFGVISEQADNNPLPPPDNKIDYDDFKIKIPQNGILKLDVMNIPVQDFSLFLLDKNYKVLKQLSSNGESNLSFTIQLNSGDYYIEFRGIPTINSYHFQYAFSTTFSPLSGIKANFAANKTQGCVPLSVNFTNISQGNATSFSWSFPGGTPNTSTSPNPTISYNNVGSFPVSLTIKNSLDNSTITRNSFINVQAPAKTDFNFVNLTRDTIKFTNLTVANGQTITYTWNFGDNTTSNEVSPTHKYPKNGSYMVSLAAKNECGVIVKSKPINLITSIEETELAANILLFPNPNKGTFSLKIDNDNFGKYTIGIINSLGEILFKQDFIKSSQIHQEELDLTSLPNGNYHVIISDYKAKIVKNIVIIR